MTQTTSAAPTTPQQQKISNALTDDVPFLYHYQPYDEEHLTELLKTKWAWCSNISNVNDPWDCTMAFKIDDEETASRTVAHLMSFLRIHDPRASYPFPEALHVVNNRFKLPEDSLTSVVLGCCTPRNIGIRIQQLVAEHWPTVRIKKMFKQHNRYALEIQDFDPSRH